MRYLAKQVNGQATRNNFIRSMDLASNRDADAALAAYSDRWFSSTRKQYLNEALKHVAAKSLFWPRHAFTDMLDEIVMDLEGTAAEKKSAAADADRLKAAFTAWCGAKKGPAPSMEKLVAMVKEFEGRYRYRCPDTFRSCWMNTGAYVTLSYGIKYEGIRFPGCAGPDESLALLKKCAMEVLAGMDHDVDDRMFRMCHAVYVSRMEKA